MRFDFDATGIGSVPFKDPLTACRIIFDTFKTIPFWPQLPRRSFYENMYMQFSERLPGLVIDEKGKTLHIDTSKVALEIEEVYQHYLDGDLEFFKISQNYAEGLYAFLELLKKNSSSIRFIKGHITGPISFALSVTDQNKRPLIYDKDLFEVLTKTLLMRARWQIKKLKEIFPNVIIFIDEPYLVSIGSSYVNIRIDDVVDKLDELIGAIKKDGALAGIHCCGNTDWSVILKRGIDIVNFDAYNFMKEFSLYGPDIAQFIARGGTIAWGVVPSSEAVDKESRSSIARKLKEALKLLKTKGIDSDTISSLITPSCGLGTLDEERAQKILALTANVSARW